MWNELFHYAIKSAIVLALLYTPYTLLLRKERIFRQNRFTLLAILVFSLVLPFCDVHVLYPSNLLASLSSKPIAIYEEEFTEISSGIPSSSSVALIEGESASFDIITWLCLIYVMGTLIVLAIRLWQFARMRRLIRKGCLWSDVEDGITIHCHAEEVAPCSWMRHIVISEHDYSHHRHEILLHEKGHVHCLHSWDILLLTLVQTIQWYNPFAYMLGASLRDVHEYEADDYVLRQGVTASEYQTLLLKTAVGNSVYAFANNFNHSLIKNRIIMMKNKKFSPWKRYKALYILPMVVVLLCVFATSGTAKTIHEVKDIDKRLYKQLDNMLLIYGDEIVETDRFLELLYSNRTPHDKLYAAIPNKKGVKQIRKLFVPSILWMPETDMLELYHRTQNEKAKNGALILQRERSTSEQSTPSFSSGTNDFMIEGHVSSDIKDVAYQITLTDDEGKTTESTVHVENGKFFYYAQLEKPTKGRIRAIFEDGSLCQAWIEQIFYPGCKLNILVMDNTYTAQNTPYTAN